MRLWLLCVVFRDAVICFVCFCGLQTGEERWVFDPPFGEICTMAPNFGTCAPPTRLLVGSGSGRIEELDVVLREQAWGVEETRTIVGLASANTMAAWLDSHGSRLSFMFHLVLLLLEVLRTL